jgi:type IV pilus assembly protein PilP
MRWLHINQLNVKGKNYPAMPVKVFCFVLISLLFSSYGCSDQPSAPPAQVAQTQPVAAAPASPTAAVQPEAEVLEVPKPTGYVYERRDRRDPFVPLIVPKKRVEKDKGVKPGTLESYDLSEFKLAAIAKKGKSYLALITTPDNRSFTVVKGMGIGQNKGKVKDITKDKIVLVEYSRDFRGQLKPREIILEFRKGEVE